MPNKNDDMLTIPVRATMQRQEDGSYEMVDAEYATISADAFARFLLNAFHVTFEEAGP